MVFGIHREVIHEKPDLVRVMIGIHQRATDYAATNKDAMVAMASSKLGQKKEAIEASVPNVELTWRLGPQQIEQSKIYPDHMLAPEPPRQFDVSAPGPAKTTNKKNTAAPNARPKNQKPTS